MNWLLRVLFWCAGALLVATVVGAVYQWWAERRDLQRYPPPGTLFTVDGYFMHLDCRGSGSPTVILEQGLQGVGSAWGDIPSQIAAHTRACVYDRAGLGYSQPVPGYQASKNEVARRLHRLLDVAGIDDDIIVAGWSAGGVYAREYYRQFPNSVKGLLLIASSHEQQSLRIPPSGRGSNQQLLTLARVLAPVGLVRLVGMVDRRVEAAGGTPEHRGRLRALYNQSHVFGSMLRESRAFNADSRSESPPTPIGDLPLIVLTPGRRFEGAAEDAAESARRREWTMMQNELVQLSTRGRQIFAAESGHGIPADQPELIVDSIAELVRLIRAEPH